MRDITTAEEQYLFDSVNNFSEKEQELFLNFAKFLNSRHESKEKTIDELSDINILTDRLNNLFAVLINNYFDWADMKNDKNRWFFINNYKQISALIYAMSDIAEEADRRINEVTDINLKNIKA